MRVMMRHAHCTVTMQTMQSHSAARIGVCSLLSCWESLRISAMVADGGLRVHARVMTLTCDGNAVMRASHISISIFLLFLLLTHCPSFTCSTLCFRKEFKKTSSKKWTHTTRDQRQRFMKNAPIVNVERHSARTSSQHISTLQASVGNVELAGRNVELA
jgi:hypothetical protein